MRNYLRHLTPMVLAVFGLTLGTACASKSISSTTNKRPPEGWVLTVNSAFVPYLEAKEDTPGYNIELLRKGKNKEDRYYIKLAESLYPDPKIIRSYQKGEKKSWYFERRWWISEYDEHRIPYSITGDTVNYYINKYKKFKEKRKKQQRLDPRKKEYKERVSFFYKAEVFRQEKADKTGAAQQIVVKLSLKWYVFCGQPCGWGFEKTKEVTFAGDDQILKVKGDGVTPLWISSAETPYAPHQWITY